MKTKANVVFNTAPKKLVIRFGTQSQNQKRQNLRDLPLSFWQLALSHCKASILSVTKGAQQTAFLLSESSLVISDSELVLITCGDTRLIDAATYLIAALTTAPIEAIWFQRHKDAVNHANPSKFEHDCSQLNAQLALLAKGQQQTTIAAEHSCWQWHAFEQASISLTPHREVQLKELSSSLCERLREPSRQVNEIKRLLYSDDFLKDWLVDEHLFTPHGFSLNALNGPHYLTVHLSPEPQHSLLSIDTNYPQTLAFQRWLTHLERTMAPSKTLVMSLSPSIRSQDSATAKALA
ncbi:hypothetical protein [Paraferrimonas haliotis]|uniref:S-adenosylmethionine decarboxylase SpeD n=1 Tax=Paraferrimonas haliotis TaxID=2013866 RepID=A0AA37WWK6_9GAMM|nr:hypothetical protein [Paraferrimonas haliotis]GLS82519.1 S-adenosylmethionine decarboxylase SpeD [Paraferrimonas haliotis]